MHFTNVEIAGLINNAFEFRPLWKFTYPCQSGGGGSWRGDGGKWHGLAAKFTSI